jgi:aspartyl-tRNA(Asn)/glutamyl-tRNA(Gln) amidotransferase subunit A
MSNLTGIPSISVPFATSNGLPIGIQLLAKHNDDKSLLKVARALETTVKLPEVPI